MQRRFCRDYTYVAGDAGAYFDVTLKTPGARPYRSQILPVLCRRQQLLHSCHLPTITVSPATLPDAFPGRDL